MSGQYTDLGAPIGSRKTDGLDGTEAGEHGAGIGVSGGQEVHSGGHANSGFNAGIGGAHASGGIPHGGHPIADKFMSQPSSGLSSGNHGSDNTVSGAYSGSGTGDALTGESHARTTGAGVGVLGENLHGQSGLSGQSGLTGQSGSTGLTGSSGVGSRHVGNDSAQIPGELSSNSHHARDAAFAATAGGAAGAVGASALNSGRGDEYIDKSDATLDNGASKGLSGGAHSGSGALGAGALGAGAGAGAASQSGGATGQQSALVKEGEATGHYGTTDDDSSRGQPLSDPKQLDSGGRHGLVYQESTGTYVHRHELEETRK